MVGAYSEVTSDNRDLDLVTRRSAWKAKTEYYSGTGTDDTLDVVKANGAWYRCIITHKSSGSFETDYKAKKWKVFSWMENLATDILLSRLITADEIDVVKIFAKFAMIDKALLAGAVCSDDKMFSQHGTIDNNESTDYTHPEFKPNILIDWLTGAFEAMKGTFSGVLKGVTGTFNKLNSPSGNAYVEFSGDEFRFNGDMWHQGDVGKGIFMAKSISVRGMFGHRGLRTLEAKNSRTSLNYIPENGSLSINVDNIGKPIDCLSVNSDSNFKIYLSSAYLSYKKLTIINTNNGQPIRVNTINGLFEIGGGWIIDLIYVPSTNMYPKKSGWMIVDRDNNW